MEVGFTEVSRLFSGYTFSDILLFQHPYIPTPLCSETPIFRHNYFLIPLYSNNPTSLCSDHPMSCCSSANQNAICLYEKPHYLVTDQLIGLEVFELHQKDQYSKFSLHFQISWFYQTTSMFLPLKTLCTSPLNLNAAVWPPNPWSMAHSDFHLQRNGTLTASTYLCTQSWCGNQSKFDRNAKYQWKGIRPCGMAVKSLRIAVCLRQIFQVRTLRKQFISTSASLTKSWGSKKSLRGQKLWKTFQESSVFSDGDMGDTNVDEVLAPLRAAVKEQVGAYF